MDKELLSINELKYRLLSKGYDRDQVDRIVWEVIGWAMPDGVGSCERQRLIAKLEYYLASSTKYCGVKR